MPLLKHVILYFDFWFHCLGRNSLSQKKKGRGKNKLITVGGKFYWLIQSWSVVMVEIRSIGEGLPMVLAPTQFAWQTITKEFLHKGLFE